MKLKDNLVAGKKLLKELFIDSPEGTKQSDPPEAAARDYFFSVNDPENIDKAIEYLLVDGEPLNPLEGLQSYRRLLALCLMTWEHTDLVHPSLNRIIEKYVQLPFWKEFQIAAVLKNLLRHYAGLELEPIKPKHFEGGATPVDWGSHWSWAESPHALYQAELGIYWYMLGYLTDDTTLIEAANNLTEWQLNALDHDLLPFGGLFTQEPEGGIRHLLPYNYILFLISAAVGEQRQYLHIVENIHEGLLKEFRNKPFEIPVHLAMIEEWITAVTGQNQEGEPPNCELPRAIYDPSVALVGLRKEDLSVVCAHFGGRTGVGAFHAGDVRIITYGPQRLPIGDCENFGIEGGQHTKEAYPHAEIQCDMDTFSIKSTVKVGSKTENGNSWALFRNGVPSMTWLEIHQRFANRTLTVTTQFFGIGKSECPALSFFIKAKKSRAGDSVDLKPCTLERYEGRSDVVRFFGEKDCIEMRFNDYRGIIQIIPLAGGDSFWGADFMLTVMNAGTGKMSITITSPLTVR